MEMIHISEAEASRDFAALLAKVRAGNEVLITGGVSPVRVALYVPFKRRTIAEAIAMLPEDSCGVIDDDFARDMQALVQAHREPLETSAWD